jgi:ABC-2 type transport system ATP-binding protein
VGEQAAIESCKEKGRTASRIVTWASSMVTVSGLTRRFGARTAVEDVSFEIRGGEIFALLGPNGAGKTTTMRILAGLIAPSAGTVSIAGRAVTPGVPAEVRARIGLLTETPGLWERLSGRENLLVYARLHRLHDPEHLVDRTLQAFGLLERAGEPTAGFSKGMKQKLALARALLHEPDVVLLDEPTAGLDPAIARSVREIVLGLREKGRAILVSTHNLDEAERLADRVAVLRTRLIAVDTPDSLRRRLFERRVRIVLADGVDRLDAVAASAGARAVTVDGRSLTVSLDDPDTQVPILVRALVEAGAEIRAVEDERPPLEEIYLKLTEEEEAVAVGGGR